MSLQVLVHGFNETVYKDRRTFFTAPGSGNSNSRTQELATAPPQTVRANTNSVGVDRPPHSPRAQHRTIWAYEASERISRGTTFMAIIYNRSQSPNISASFYGRE